MINLRCTFARAIHEKPGTTVSCSPRPAKFMASVPSLYSKVRGGGRSQFLVRPDRDQNLFITGKSTTLCGPTLCGPFDHYRANYWPDQGRGGRGGSAAYESTFRLSDGIVLAD